VTQTYSGGCQCGKVRYEVSLDIQSFAIGKNPKTGAEVAGINVRCLDDADADTFRVRKVDGKSF